MKEKNRINNSSKTISSIFLNINYFKISSSTLLNCSFKIRRFTLHRKYFLKDLLRQVKYKNKRTKVWLLQMKLVTLISYPKFCSQNSKKKFVFSCFTASYTFPLKHSKQFYSVTGVKKTEMTKLAVNYIRQYQLRFS